MAKTAFQNLRVYWLGEDLACRVWELVAGWNGFAKDTVGKQIVRAADSIGANIAEGSGRGSYVDNRRFVRIARGSLNEVMHFLRCAYRRKLMTQEQVDGLKPLIDNLAPQLNTYLKSIGSRAKQKEIAPQSVPVAH